MSKTPAKADAHKLALAALGDLDAQQLATLRHVLESESRMPAKEFRLLLMSAIRHNFRPDSESKDDGPNDLLARMLQASMVAKNIGQSGLVET